MNALKLILCACCLLGCSDPNGFKGDVRSLRFSPDGKQLLAFGNFSGKWEPRVYRVIGDEKIQHLQTLPEKGTSANWNPDGTAIYCLNPNLDEHNSPTPGRASVIEKRSSTTFQVLQKVESPGSLVGQIVEVGPNHLVFGDHGFDDVFLFRPTMLNTQGKTSAEKTSDFGGCPGEDYLRVFSLEGTGGNQPVVAVSYSWKCPVEIWDIVDLKPVKRFDLPIKASCWLDISGSGQILATLQRSKLVVWNLKTDKPTEILTRSFATPSDEEMWEYLHTRRLSFDKSGELIAACSEDEGVKVIDVNSNAVVFELKKPIQSCALSPDGKLIAVAYASKQRVHLFSTGL